MAHAETRDLLKQAIALARAGDKAQARSLLRRVVEDAPGSEAAWMWTAGVAESPQEALAALEQVLALNPNNERAQTAAVAARLQVGVAAAKAGKKLRARALLRAVVESDPSSEMAWLWLANVAASPADAVACLEKVLALDPNHEHARATLERCRATVRADRQPAPAAPVAPSEALADVAQRPDAGRTVLAVDGDPDALDSIVTAVRTRGYRALAAADGYRAVDWLREHGAPDLFLIAVSLPGGMDGYQLCKFLRENPGTTAVPVVFLAEADSIIGKVRGRLAGAVTELVKPFEPEDLLRVVEQVCPPAPSVFPRPA